MFKINPFAVRLSLVLLALCAARAVVAQEEFARNFEPSISFSEKRHENVHYVADYEDYDRYYDAATVAIAARASMQGVDLTAIGPDTAVELTLGDFSFSAALADSPTYQPGDRTIVFKIDADSDEVEESSLTVRYDAAAVTFTVNLSRDSDAAWSPVASTLEGSEYAPGEFQDVTTGGFAFGDRALSERNVYFVGTRVAIYSKRVGAGTDLDQTFDDLVDVVVQGAADSDGPQLATATPGENSTVRQAALDVVISASDLHEVASVQVQVNGGPWEDCAAAEDGAWTLQVTLLKGANVLVAQATDTDGNVTVTSVRHVRFAPLTTLTVDAAGTGAGTVGASYLAAFSYLPSAASPVRTVMQEEDAALTLTATPGVGSVFDGWSSNVALTAEQASSPTLHFTLAPDQTLTAHFLPNPFFSTLGTYSGLIASEQPAQQGFLNVKLDAKGAFTGRIRIGALSLALRGKFSNGGHFSGQFTKAGVAYTVTLDLAVAAGGARQVLGAISGGGIAATCTGDRQEFNKTTPAPQQGIYNLVLAPAAENTDANYPVGHGFGRVTVSKTGFARFSGRLGDRTAVTFGASLSRAGGWPFFTALYGRAGSISGTVGFADLTQTDLTGGVAWFKPAGLQAQLRFPGGFTGRSEIAGVKFPSAAPLATRMIFPADGNGSLTLEAPAAIAGTHALPPISSDDPVLLGTDNRFQLPADARQLKFVISAATGLFRGSFVAPLAGQPVTTSFSGAVLLPKGTFAGAAAGCFTRGKLTGSVVLTAPQ
jgi:hypothetical protein